MDLAPHNIDYSILSEPFQGERCSGDLGIIKVYENHLLITAIDVAGHGQNANEIALQIKSFIEQQQNHPLCRRIEALHEYLKGSRGCVGGFALFDTKKRILTYCGVGNIHARVIGTEHKRFVNRGGIIGYMMPSLREETHTLIASDIFILYSDGINECFELEPSLLSPETKAETIAHIIMQRFNKQTDDAICIVIKCN